jgi:hypothetical protein
MPRTRARVVKDEIETREALLRSGPLNTTGLPALPPEILLEIISYFPTIPVPLLENRNIFEHKYQAREKALSALSQTCVILRRVFLPLRWQRLEVCEISKEEQCSQIYRPYMSKDPRKRALATELVWQLEAVTIRDPSLAQYVQ